MIRPLSFLLISALVASAAPARAQNFFEALADAIDAASDDGGSYEYEYQYNNGRNNGWYNDGYNNGWYNGNYYRPAQPQQQRIWNGSYWETVPVSPYQGGMVVPQTVYPQTVVSPATTITSAAVVANALPYKGPGVTIKLEESEGGAVTYLVDGKESATIQAGQQQTLTTKGRYEVRFSRGAAPDGRSFGEARYTLTEGNYSFKVTDKGWELLRDKDQPALAAAQTSSPSGIKTNALPPKTAPGATSPSAPASSPVPPAPAAPAANVLPTKPAAPAAPATSVVPPPAAPAG